MTEDAERSEGTGEGETPPVHGVRVRPATAQDLPVMAGLLVRLKRLNEEFDPLLKVREDAEDRAEKVLTADLGQPQSLLLVAEGTGPDEGKVVGVSRALVRERPFYLPEREGVIQDIYLLPAYRRHRVGEYLLSETVRQLKGKGASLVTAEFPAQNQIATRFYAKRGFRPIVATHAKRL